MTGKTNEFGKLMREYDVIYDNGEWKESIPLATAAMSVAKDDEEIAFAQNGRGWGQRYVGYKTDDPKEKQRMYELAREMLFQAKGISCANVSKQEET